MIDFQKLKHEWKTAAVAIVGAIVETWDLVSYQFDLIDPLIPVQHQWIMHISIPVLMLLLRKWRDAEDF